MLVPLRRVTPIVALSVLLAACNAQAAVAPTVAPTAVPTAAPTAAPTGTPEPTAVPTLNSRITVAGVSIGGLDLDAARTRLAESLPEKIEPLLLATGELTSTITPEQIGLAPDVDAILAAAEDASAGTKLPLTLSYDAEKLRDALDSLAGEVASSDSGVEAIRDTEAISASFVLRGAQELDVDLALEQVEQYLAEPDFTEPLTLELTLDPDALGTPSKAQLQAELDAMAEEFDGVLGAYIYDLKTGEEVASINQGTAFSTASTIKVAILLNAYAHVDSFTAKQVSAMEKMIIDSDNLRANDVMAISVGGTSTESAFEGLALMSQMLVDLGLPTTYQYTPFEASDFIKLYKPKYQLGPKQAGEAPFTASSRVQRTTPYEMAQIYVMINQCTQGGGPLVDMFPDTLTPERCQEMVDLLERNADTSRMVSGLPEGTLVAHKSGWAQPEIQGDAGIVWSPGGDFIMTVYAYQDGEGYKDSFIKKLLGNVARLAYTYYNPEIAPAE